MNLRKCSIKPYSHCMIKICGELINFVSSTPEFVTAQKIKAEEPRLKEVGIPKCKPAITHGDKNQL